MAIRTIIEYPDPRLRQPAEPVTRFDAALKMLAQDLLETMRAAPGIGITAPHIGVPLRLVVIELSAEAGARFYVNPAIVSASAEKVLGEEGSVSMPGAVETVERAASVELRYQYLDGNARIEQVRGLLAVCLQHEIDQLDGLFWIYRLSRLRRERLVKRYGKERRAL